MVNLHYVRAAIEANTGYRLSLSRVRELLVEEGLLTSEEAERDARLFQGYGDLFGYDDKFTFSNPYDENMGLPDQEIPGG